jgi:hypothetical protein
MTCASTRLKRLNLLPLTTVYARRVRLHWEIFTRASDKIERPLSPINPKFWRRLSAERIVSAMRAEINTAAWIALE